MTQYIKKPHGLMITRDNLFKIEKSNNIYEYFPYYIFFERLYPKTITTLNYNIIPPAIQILWKTTKLPLPSTGFSDDFYYHHEPNNWFKNWLDRECLGWYAPSPIIQGFSETERIIYLHKYNHALKISNLVNFQLKSLKFGF